MPSQENLLQRPPFRTLLLLSVLLLGAGNQLSADDAENFFERKVRPLLVEKCISCHGPSKQEADLRLDSRQQILSGTDDIAALVTPGNPDDSRLLQVLLYAEDDTQMPPKEKLSDAQIDAVRKWIAAGAIWPDDHDFGKAAAVDKNAWRQHWAFQPIANPDRPAIGDSKWHPIDAYIRASLQAKNIAPSPTAEGRTLVRRLSYALTGLPPQLSDLQAVEQVSGEAALHLWLTEYTDRLLSSPQFGERWGRYWLDVARYADTKGYVFQEDREYHDAWRYREWVINSLNNDMPYDEFLKRQIAADQLPGADDPAQLAAMGFFTLGRRFLNNKHDIIDDRIDVLSRGTMGLTVTCARCHDHKYDPVPMSDYYALYGVFDSSSEPGGEPSPLRLVDLDKPREPVIFLRGSPGNRGDRVTRHFLTALSKDENNVFRNGSGRLELAEKIASKENPLTARVAVNRIWLRLFGRGLVDAASDFGVRTAAPTHPELLDHLATYFIANNWSRKALIRYIVTSYTWRQSSQPRSDTATSDPENRLLARMPRRRLDFECFRDSLLSAAGRLDTTIGGKSVDITTPPFTTRRSIYARIDRQNFPGVFRTFDVASPDNHSPGRFETTVPQQALFQLNSPFVMEQAEKAAANVRSTTPQDLIRELYTSILRRQPTAEELSISEGFLVNAAAYVPAGQPKVGWQYGWGEISEAGDAVVRFTAFPTFHDNRWMGSQTFPDEKLGYLMLHRDGGHPGPGRKNCVIRRWIADRDSRIRVTGTIKHPASEGDGVTAHVIVGGRSMAVQHAHNSNGNVSTEPFDVAAGTVVNFVVESGETQNHDSFHWSIGIGQTGAGDSLREWNSSLDFAGRQGEERLKPETQLAQTLMLSNEFMFVD